MAEPNLIGGFSPELVQEPPGATPIAPGAGSEASWLSRLLSGVKEFATSDMGRGMSGALGVGLLGLHPNPALQQHAMQMVMQQAAEREKMRMQTMQAGNTAKVFSGILTAARSGDHGAVVEGIQKALNDPSLVSTMGPAGISTLMQVAGKSAETLGKSEAVQRALQKLGGLPNIRTPEHAAAAIMALTGPGLMPIEQAEAFIKTMTPFGRMGKKTAIKDAAGNITGWTDEEGKTYSVNPSGGAPSPGPLAPAQQKPEALTVENVLKGSPHAADIASRSGYNLADLVNQANQGSEGAKHLLGRIGEISSAISQQDRESKVAFQETDVAAAKLSGSKYRTFAELLTAARGGDRDAVALIPKVAAEAEATKSRIQASAEREKLTFQMNEMPAAMQEGFRNRVLVNRKTLKEDSAVPPRAFMGENRTHTVISEQDSKLWSGMNVMERSIPLLEEMVPRLATTTLGVLKQRFEATLMKYFGEPTMGGVVSTLEALKLRMAATFQGANAQLSDKDVAAVAGLSLTPWDSQDTAKLKIAGLKAMARVIKASLADSEPEAARALAEYRGTLDKILGAVSGVPGMKIPPR